jgi:hypothetical protein
VTRGSKIFGFIIREGEGGNSLTKKHGDSTPLTRKPVSGYDSGLVKSNLQLHNTFPYDPVQYPPAFFKIFQVVVCQEVSPTNSACPIKEASVSYNQVKDKRTLL